MRSESREYAHQFLAGCTAPEAQRPGAAPTADLGIEGVVLKVCVVKAPQHVGQLLRAELTEATDGNWGDRFQEGRRWSCMF
mmetsp:Transcript_175918/g.427937  ORF Transcript_175918/g.427937 Transcript_175918/m.427937 type:complete len:81 (+) Transcript_175918:975-1217(+)